MKTLSIPVLRRTAGALVALAYLAAPSVVRAVEPTLAEVETDPSAVPPEGTKSRLLWTGAALTVGWYGASVGSSLLWQDAPRHQDWQLPIVGPWKALGDVRCGANESDCGTFLLVVRTALTLISSVGQVGGLFVLGEGFLLNTTPKSAVGSKAQSNLNRGIEWATIPMAEPNGFGLKILGRF